MVEGHREGRWCTERAASRTDCLAHALGECVELGLHRGSHADRRLIVHQEKLDDGSKSLAARKRRQPERIRRGGPGYGYEKRRLPRARRAGSKMPRSAGFSGKAGGAHLREGGVERGRGRSRWQRGDVPVRRIGHVAEASSESSGLGGSHTLRPAASHCDRSLMSSICMRKPRIGFMRRSGGGAQRPARRPRGHHGGGVGRRASRRDKFSELNRAQASSVKRAPTARRRAPPPPRPPNGTPPATLPADDHITSRDRRRRPPRAPVCAPRVAPPHRAFEISDGDRRRTHRSSRRRDERR